MSDQLTFDAYRTPVRKGVTLVEASAGTGKTFTIAMLVLRAVVELGISIDQILVVTFTIAATVELRDRVRQRLIRARYYLKNRENKPPDKEEREFHEWLDTIKDPDRVVQRLDLALLDIDRAAIHTIHGFCQKTLNELALESGQPFDIEFTGDVSLVRNQVVHDYWRRRVYQLDERYCNLVISSFQSPEKLYKSIAGAEDVLAELVPDPVDFNEVCADFDVVLEGLHSWWEREGRGLKTSILNGVAGGFFKAKSATQVAAGLERLDSCFAKKLGPVPADLSRLRHDKLIEMLNGNKLRGDEKKKQFIAAWALPEREGTTYLKAADDLLRGIRLELAEELRTDVMRRMRAKGTMSFDDLIMGLARAVGGQSGAELCRQVRLRYKIALIDEFQDTDSAQWRIFSTLFAGKQHYLYLIGDPKQAIYRFRGADIFSYFSARNTADRRLTLERNYRSNPGLMAAVNALFESFEIGGVPYQPVLSARSAEDGRLLKNENEVPALVYCQLDQKSPDKPTWSAEASGDMIRAWIVSEVVSLISKKSSIRVESIEATGEMKRERIVPADIAILVRSHREAEAYQAGFRHIGIPAVITSKKPVFATEECVSLLLIMQAIAGPGNERLLKTAMSCNWFGLSGDAHFRICNNVEEFIGWQERFQEYFEVWQQAGFLPMINRFLETEQVAIRLGGSPGAERRISNIQHLTELIQEAENKAHYKMSQTLLWLQEMAGGKQHHPDEVELRLESDADSLRIITMHSAKGLEFPVVFCPSLLTPSYHKVDISLVHSHQEDGTRICDLGSEEFEMNKERALLEEQQEDLRLAYVAVTRAQLRCYVIWAEIKKHQMRPSSFEASLGRLLFPHGTTGFEDQKGKLESRGAAPYCDYRLIDNQEIETAYHPEKEQEEIVLEPREPTARIFTTNRTRTSFSGLAMLSYKDSHEQLSGAFDESDQSIAMVSDTDKDQQGLKNNNLPGGVRFGNIVHDALEQLSFSDLAAKASNSEQLAVICQRHNMSVDHDDLARLLHTSVTTRLSADISDAFALADLDEKRIVKEMEFTLHLEKSSTRKINDLLVDESCVSALSARQIEGYLTGFIDLVCRVNGRYFVIDYKTNHLGDTATSYERPSLLRAMRSHNYGLQYWLYTLVVHRHLQRWLPHYHYSDHFGGVMYLFVRGMQPEHPGNSVFFSLPDENILKQLDKSFGTITHARNNGITDR